MENLLYKVNDKINQFINDNIKLSTLQFIINENSDNEAVVFSTYIKQNVLYEDCIEAQLEFARRFNIKAFFFDIDTLNGNLINSNHTLKEEYFNDSLKTLRNYLLDFIEAKMNSIKNNNIESFNEELMKYCNKPKKQCKV